MFIGTTAALIIGGASIVGSTVGGIITGNNAAQASENIAKEQAAMAERVLQMQREDREFALKLAQSSPSESAAIARQYQMAEQSLSAQLESIEKDRELMNAVDPALKEAGHQALQLLQGKEAAALGPLKAERTRQRDMLESNLRDALGSGFNTSSAGMEALNRFDAESQSVLAGAQQQTMGALLGLSAGVRPDVAGKEARAYGTSSQIAASALAGTQNVAARQVAAYNGSAVNYQGVVNTSGSQYVGDLGRAQALGNLFGNIGQIGGSFAGYGMQNSMLDKYLARSDVSGHVNIGGGGAAGGFNYGGSNVPSSYNSPLFGQIGGR